MPRQRLNDLERLAVVKQVHHPGVPEGVRYHPDRKKHPILICTPDRGLQPVAHGLIGCAPELLAALRPLGGKPALYLAHLARIREGHQAHRVLGRARRLRTFSDRIRTNDSGGRLQASPMRAPVFQRVLNRK